MKQEQTNLTKTQQFIVDFYHKNPFVEYLQAEVVPTADGGVQLELTVEAEHTNLYGIIHGGVLMSLADTAMGAAALTHNKKVVTMNLSMDFMHSVPMTTRLIATGTVLHDGRHTMTLESDIRNAEGKLFAKGHGTFYVLGLVEE
ncbi:PaaI family thioesterase [Selenomonas caprae]|uniref:PaaI family thioesterase n=1 Tax=Selenomonas caprae TaxID=2606905 RepID=UPI002105CEF2|nr:PaaI family thioesterase [Selenomonas caprae]